MAPVPLYCQAALIISLLPVPPAPSAPVAPPVAAGAAPHPAPSPPGMIRIRVRRMVGAAEMTHPVHWLSCHEAGPEKPLTIECDEPTS